MYPDLTVKENLDVIPQRAVPQKEQWSVEKIFAMFPVLRNLQGSKGMELSGWKGSVKDHLDDECHCIRL